MTTFADEQIELVEFCAAECERQQSGERSVAHMVSAWDWASRSSLSGDKISVQRILALGTMVEPLKNANGLRKNPVFFGEPVPGGYSMGLDPKLVRRALTSLCQHGDRLTPEQWYTEFERIHPFIDGNGRVGVILYNWKRRTMVEPVTPPPYKER